MLYQPHTTNTTVPNPPPPVQDGPLACSLASNGNSQGYGITTTVTLYVTSATLDTLTATIAVSGQPTGVTVAALYNSPSPGFYLTIASGDSVTPGTYTLTVAVTVGSYTAYCYYTLVQTDTPNPNPVPPAQGGLAVWWTGVSSLTLNLNDNAVLPIGLSPNGTAELPVQLSISGLPAYSYAQIQASYTSLATIVWLYTTLQTPPGSYTLVVTAIAPDGTTTYDMTLTVTTTVSPANQTAITKATGRYYGVVRRNHSGRALIRRMAIPLNPNGPRQSQWRHIFSTTKQLWRSLGPGGINNIPIASVSPQSAWTAENITYWSSRLPGNIIDNVQAEATPGPLSSGEAYMVMCQTTMANIGQPSRTPPLMTETGITTPAPANSTSFSGFTWGVSAQPVPGVLSQVYGPTLAWPLGPFQVNLALTPPSGSPPALTITLGYTDAYITATLSGPDTSVERVMTVTVSPSAPAGVHAVAAEITYMGNTYSALCEVTVGATPLQVLFPAPVFPPLTSAAVYTTYDEFYNVVGFQLVYALNSIIAASMVINLQLLTADLKLTASPIYTSSYSKPSASTYQPLGYNVPNAQVPATLLALWEAVYGPLPTKGNIVFAVVPYDPSTGAMGAAVTMPVGFAAGTLKGFNRAAWLGPIWNIESALSNITQAHGTTQTYEFPVQGASSQTGWGGGAGVPYGGTVVWSFFTTDPFPGTVDATFGIPNTNIPSGDTSVIDVTLTITTPAANWDPAVVWTVLGSDGISSSAFSFQLNIT